MFESDHSIMHFACTFFSPKWIVDMYFEYLDYSHALPSGGVYCNDISSVEIQFEEGTVIFCYPDGTTESVNIDYHGRMIGENSGLIAHYKWKQVRNQIELHIERENRWFEEGKAYIFTSDPGCFLVAAAIGFTIDLSWTN